jgi:hypothetical protein
MPTTLAAARATTTGIPTSRAAPTDNVGLVGYDVYVNSAKFDAATSLAHTFESLACSTSYTLGVDAYDAAGNRSKIASATTTTSPCVTAPSSGMLYGSGPWGEGAWPPGNWAPYSRTSPWNRPLPGFSSAILDPHSKTEVTWMNNNLAHTFTPQDVSNTPSQDAASGWDHPLYWAKSSDPAYTINDTGYACYAGHTATFCPSKVQIPNGAWHATGSDGDIAIVQPNGHTEIDLGAPQTANPFSGGGTVVVHGFGGLDLNGTGCCGNASAANQGLAAGSIRGQELAAGVINHALSVVAKCTNGTHVAPATGNALGGCPNAPADGARLQLRMSDSQVDALAVPAYQKTILKAMAHYGLFITDTGGGPMDLDYEPAIDYTSFGNTSNTVMSYLQTQGYSDPYTITIALPWTDFQVVSPCYAARTCHGKHPRRRRRNSRRHPGSADAVG